jgi:shikimate kinase
VGLTAVKLVFIYGPPAVGKLTVATELSRQIGFKLYHNHVSINFVKSIFDFGTPTFQKLVDRYRREMLEEAARQQVDTIFTFVYGKGEDDEFVKDIIRRVESHKGKVLFVRLYCTRKELARRVGIKSRKKQGKLASKRDLENLFREFDLLSEVPSVKSLSIETSHNSPRQVARRIASYYKLTKSA